MFEVHVETHMPDANKKFDEPAFRKSLTPLVVALLLGLVFVGVVSYYQRQMQNNRLRELSANVIQRLQTNFSGYVKGLEGIRSAIYVMGNKSGVTRAGFTQLIHSHDLSSEFPGLRGFAYVQRVPMGEDALYLKRMRDQGVAIDAFKEFEANPDDRYVVSFIEPERLNAKAIGLDIASNPSRKTAIHEAVRTGMPTLSMPFTLVQSNGPNDYGFLLNLPVYREGKTPATESGRLRNAQGIVNAVLMANQVFNAIYFDYHLVQLELFDHSEKPFYSSASLSDSKLTSHVYQVPLRIYGREWVAKFTAKSAFIDQQLQFSPWLGFVFLMGLGLYIARLRYVTFKAIGDHARCERDAEVLQDALDKQEACLQGAQKALAEFSVRAKNDRADLLLRLKNELKLPLNAVLVNNEMLLKMTLPKRVIDMLTGIASNLQTILRVVDDTVDYACISANQLVLKKELFDIEIFYRNLCQKTKSLALAKGIHFDQVPFPIGVPTQVVGDEKCLSQILMPILSNAVQFTESGFVRFELRLMNLLGTAARSGMLQIEFEVSDSGVGLTEPEIRQIVAPPTLGASGLNGRCPGHKMSLAIVRELVQMMHGDLEIHSEIGNGSSFIVTLWLWHSEYAEAMLPDASRDSRDT